MSTKKKLLISLCSLCLVAAVVVIGVFAFATQTFTINNRVTFTATDVKAQVIIYGINGEDYPDDLIQFPDGSNQLYDADRASETDDPVIYMGDPTDGNPDLGMTWMIDASANSNLNTTHTIPDQEFKVVEVDGKKQAKPITIFIAIENLGDKDFSVTLTESYLENLKNVDNISVAVNFSLLDNDESTSEVGTIANGGTISKGETFLVQITYQVDDIGLSANLGQALQFVLAGV